MGNVQSGPNDGYGQNSFQGNTDSFRGNTGIMDSFDDRGGGRSVAKNLYASDSYDAEEDTWDKLPASKGKLPESKGKLPAESMGTFPRKPQAMEKTASKQNVADKDADVAEKKYNWAPIPEVNLPPEAELMLSRRTPIALALQRKTKKIVEAYTSKEEVAELQLQEQERALKMQKDAIKKVLLKSESARRSAQKESNNAAYEIRNAKEKAWAIQEYNKHGSLLFSGYDDYTRNKRSGP